MDYMSLIYSPVNLCFQYFCDFQKEVTARYEVPLDFVVFFLKNFHTQFKLACETGSCSLRYYVLLAHYIGYITTELTMFKIFALIFLYLKFEIVFLTYFVNYLHLKDKNILNSWKNNTNLKFRIVWLSRHSNLFRFVSSMEI